MRPRRGVGEPRSESCKARCQPVRPPNAHRVRSRTQAQDRNASQSPLGSTPLVRTRSHRSPGSEPRRGYPTMLSATDRPTERRRIRTRSHSPLLNTDTWVARARFSHGSPILLSTPDATCSNPSRIGQPSHSVRRPAGYRPSAGRQRRPAPSSLPRSSTHPPPNTALALPLEECGPPAASISRTPTFEP